MFMDDQEKIIERALRLISDGPAVLYACKADGDFGATFISPNIKQQLGYTTEQFLGDSKFWFNHIHPDDRDRILSELDQIFDHGSHIHEYRFLHADGNYRWMHDELRLVKDEAGTPIELIGYWTDITDRKFAEDRSEKHSARLNNILQNTHDAIITIYEDGRIESFNAAAERSLSYSEDEVVGQHIEILIAEPCRVECRQLLQTLSDQENPGDINHLKETICLSKTGEEIPVEVAFSSISLKDQLLVIATMRDISERKQLDKMKNEFVSVVSHELRTPLTAIHGAIGLIARLAGADVGNEIKGLVEIANKNSLRLKMLVDELLDFEKLASGQFVMNMTPFEVETLIKDAIELNRPYAEIYRVRYLVNADCLGMKVQADYERSVQVLTNLLSNAAKFSPEGGDVFVDANIKGEFVRVSVRDQGKGVPKEFESELFKQFTQLDSSSSRRRSGTGLGLSIAKKFVERMGGEIGYERHENSGAIFYFKLPIFKGLGK